MDKNNKKLIVIHQASIAVLFLILIAMAGCTNINETPLSTQTVTETNSTIANLQNKTNTPSSTPRNTMAIISFTETTLPTTNTPAPPTGNQLLGKNSIAIMELGASTVYMLDIETGYMRMLHLPPEYRPFQVLSWSNNGCDMIVDAQGQGQTPGAILKVDLQGNIVQNLLSFDHSKIRNISISPSEEWIAYRLSEGENLGGYELIYEFENIEVISAKGEINPYQLTQRNGGREVAWAPDSKRLAYGDFDENGVPQLYVSNLDGNGRIQLTQFDDPLVEIRHIQWSPDGEKIAFAYERQGNISSMKPRKTDVMIISIQTGELPAIVDQIYLVSSLWWQENNTLVVHGYKENSTYSAPDDFLFWVDTSTGQITYILKSEETPGGYIEIPHLFGSSTSIGFFTAGDFYSYDPITHNFQTWSNVNVWKISASFILGDWVSAPSSFQGEVDCRP